jgi:hypothetical protein
MALYQASCPCVWAQACSGECQPGKWIIGRYITAYLGSYYQADITLHAVPAMLRCPSLYRVCQ